MNNLETQIIRKEVEEKLKDLAGQIGKKLGEQQAIIGKIVEAFTGLSSTIEALEERLSLLEDSLDKVRSYEEKGKEL